MLLKSLLGDSVRLSPRLLVALLIRSLVILRQPRVLLLSLGGLLVHITSFVDISVRENFSSLLELDIAGDQFNFLISLPDSLFDDLSFFDILSGRESLLASHGTLRLSLHLKRGLLLRVRGLVSGVILSSLIILSRGLLPQIFMLIDI